jgi:hypothetical protein
MYLMTRQERRRRFSPMSRDYSVPMIEDTNAEYLRHNFRHKPVSQLAYSLLTVRKGSAIGSVRGLPCAPWFVEEL